MLIEANDLYGNVDTLEKNASKCFPDYIRGIHAAKLEIARAPVVDPVKWVSVSEKLPEDERPVLTFMGYGGERVIGFQQIQSYFCFDPNPHWQYGGLLRDGQSITHWMPLPDPPRMDGEV
ncbi:hypothetical protein DSECCO2_396900 [anaerobic digester metagenome]